MCKWKYIFVLATALFLCGCASSEYYKDRAADSAREFIFSEFKHISPENKAFIQFTYPKILAAPILPGANYSQYCFAWDLPSPKITVLVYGASSYDFRGWSPVRVIFKQYTKDEIESEQEMKIRGPEKLDESDWVAPKRSHS